MPAEVKEQIQLEVAHVLFIDTVGYSKLSINEQRAGVDELTTIVRGSDQYQKAEAADRLIKIPTGDGMALVFYTNQEAPAQCAIEISSALKAHPRLQVRMGVHSGPVSGVIDVNGQTNLAGAGINMAQRVMNCGDAGHILVSKHVAEDLEEYEHWRPLLHDLGTCEVKHGMRVGIANLYADQVGNPQLPKKFQAVKTHGARMRWAVTTAALLALAAIVAGIAMFSRYRVRAALAAPEKSIAVLPFENLSEDKANAYFAVGIQEEILTRLAGIAGLKVISRTSTQQYQNKPRNLGEIANQLGVTHVLEGSVQKAADQVRVNVQLIYAQTDSHLWADTYDRKLTDIFGVESEVAKRIAESLQAKLTRREEQVLAVKPTNNSEAYEAYLRGLALETSVGYSFDSRPKIIDFYERAVQLDPSFALAWGRLSCAHAYCYFVGEYQPIRATSPPGGPAAACGDAARKTLENAQKFGPNEPRTLLALGYYQFWVLRDFGLAKSTFGQVRKTLPGSSEAPRALGSVSQREGHWDESIAYLEQALVLDPRNPDILGETAKAYAVLRQFPKALNLINRALDILPNDTDLVTLKSIIYQAQGHLQEAAKLLVDVNIRTPSDEAFGNKVKLLTFERNLGEAIRLLQARTAQFQYGPGKSRWQVWLAILQGLAGDTAGAKATAEEALKTLESLDERLQGNPNIVQALSLAKAEMGEKDAALKDAERAIMLAPSDKNPVEGPALEETLAQICTLFGENGRAISILTRLLQTPYISISYYPMPITPAHLRLDPRWDRLRGDPAFQKLCQEKQP
jgi:TolB-like protein/predicted Zn-dependent protease